jgi:hypothetical protein
VAGLAEVVDESRDNVPVPGQHKLPTELHEKGIRHWRGRLCLFDRIPKRLRERWRDECQGSRRRGRGGVRLLLVIEIDGVDALVCLGRGQEVEEGLVA